MILTLELPDDKIRAIHKFAESRCKNINTIFADLIDFITNGDDKQKMYDIVDDPLFVMKPRKTKAPRDLSKNVDNYLYGK